MNTVEIKLNELKSKVNGYWGERIISQLYYANNLSVVHENKYEDLINKALDLILDSHEKEGSLTNAAAKQAEEIILPIADLAKSFQMICVSHAHIDMNWMWGMAETVAVTLDTFRTMLTMMKEYPAFTFSQSQASVYKIVEEHDPMMLAEIKERIHEGRWELTASTWVETDKNMPNGESLARHILYTKKYLSDLFDIDPDSLQIDFEPDTFGHNINVPEIVTSGGVKYYYHCRGYNGHSIYRWKSPSESEILVYKEPNWYNSDIQPDMAYQVPAFCHDHFIDTMLKVYGVGNHGGGPTRKDIEKIIEMNTWPVFPSIRFGTLIEYFKIIEKQQSKFPLVESELNFVFEGCYTTQSRIKMANRISESKMVEAETFNAISSTFSSGQYSKELFKNAWEKVLFNHFHDILPGSGVIDTREYALGQFQQVLAAANTSISNALRLIASDIDTHSLITVEDDIADTISEGAGVGYAIKDFSVPQTERGRGKKRIFHVFNPSSYQRKEVVELTVWDWPGNQNRISMRNSKLEVITHQLMKGPKKVESPIGHYWAHNFFKVFIEVNVPPYGYDTYLLDEDDMGLPVDTDGFPDDWRNSSINCYILENENMKATFNSMNMAVVSLFDKKTNQEKVDSNQPSGIFRLIDEDDKKGMTAWVIGRYVTIADLNENVRILSSQINKEALMQWICYEMNFRNSKINVKVSLAKGSSELVFQVECDWQEISKKGSLIPQLSFYMPFNEKCHQYKYDIPFGTIERVQMDRDVPANSWGMMIPEEKEKSSLMIVTDSKYGFRGTDQSLSVTLLRSSYDPDPYPEFGIHHFRLGISIVEKPDDHLSAIKKAMEFNQPLIFLSGTKHEGMLPLSKSYLSLDSRHVAVSSLKMSDDEEKADHMVIRVYETEGKEGLSTLQFDKKVKNASYVDINEKLVLQGDTITVKDNTVIFNTQPYKIVTLLIQFY
ncbi:MAG: alpha-mannosidase [Clostridia bacterium]|nr:alpha-mannosidase [Clostridia bacterium]